MILDARGALTICVNIAALTVAVGSLEILSRWEQLGDGQLLNWSVSRLRLQVLSDGYSGRVIDQLLCFRHFRWLMIARLFLAMSVPFAEFRTRAVLLSLVSILSLLWSVRSPYGQDGADQMCLLITVSTTVSDFVGSTLVQTAATVFIAAQLGLSYFVAGLAKLSSPIWRSGEALPRVFRTRVYGNDWLCCYLIRFNGVAILGSWSLMILEILFPFGFLAPTPVLYFLMALMGAFHLASAVLMGLNSFLPAFVACYPCWFMLHQLAARP